MGLLSASSIQSDVNSVLADTTVTEAVTYKSISSVHSDSTLKTTETPTSISTRALIGEFTDKEIANSGGAIKAADRSFMIRASALSSVTPKTQDRITYSGRDWEIINFDTIKAGSTALAYIFQGR